MAEKKGRKPKLKNYEFNDCECRFCGETNPSKFKLTKLGSKEWCRECLGYGKALTDYSDLKTLRKDKEEAVIRLRAYYLKNKLKQRLDGAHYRCKREGKAIDIDLPFLEDLLEKQNNKCIYSGIEFDNTNSVYSVSIDRIDSKRGYTKDNVQLVISAVNFMKQEYTEEIFLELCKAIYLNRFN